jgi:hypothetical protein
MSQQLGLYLPLRPLARRTDPSTSHVAAARAGSLAGAHQVKILEALAQGDGTIYVLAERSGLTHVQVARRLPDLTQANRIRLTGEEREGPTGRMCRVWALA